MVERLFVVADAAALVADLGHECLFWHGLGGAGLRKDVGHRSDASLLHRVEYLLTQRRAVLCILECADVRSHESGVYMGGEFATTGVEAINIEVAIPEATVRLGEFGQRV